MLYTEQDLNTTASELKKRRGITIAITAFLLCAAIVVFVIGQNQRIDKLWYLTTAITVLGVGLFIFLYGVWVKPCRVYLDLIQYMLTGKKRMNQGLLQSVGTELCLREGLVCHRLTLVENPGTKDACDVLLYFDTYKPLPKEYMGKEVCIWSNNGMVASISEKGR